MNIRLGLTDTWLVIKGRLLMSVTASTGLLISNDRAVHWHRCRARCVIMGPPSNNSELHQRFGVGGGVTGALRPHNDAIHHAIRLGRQW